jgi:hypothetical protein
MGNRCSAEAALREREQLEPVAGEIYVLVCTLDYSGAGEIEDAGSLTSSTDAKRFLNLVKSCGVPEENIVVMGDTEANVDTELWPNATNLEAKLIEFSKKVDQDDMFVFFFAGHGDNVADSILCGDEGDGMDEYLVLTKDGQIDPFLDDKMSAVLGGYFPKTTKILMVTDCCHSGTVCDLDSAYLSGHEIVHYAAVQDYQEANDVGGGAFTTSLIETVEDLVGPGGGFASGLMSVEDLYQSVNTKFGPKWKNMSQNFNYQSTKCADPDTFPWPFLPAKGWAINTLLD